MLRFTFLLFLPDICREDGEVLLDELSDMSAVCCSEGAPYKGVNAPCLSYLMVSPRMVFEDLPHALSEREWSYSPLESARDSAEVSYRWLHQALVMFLRLDLVGLEKLFRPSKRKCVALHDQRLNVSLSSCSTRLIFIKLRNFKFWNLSRWYLRCEFPQWVKSSFSVMHNLYVHDWTTQTTDITN